jgi:hypothetical protein
MLQRPGIVAVHANTSANALHDASRQTRDPQTRRLLLLQAAAFMPLFRDLQGGGLRSPAQTCLDDAWRIGCTLDETAAHQMSEHIAKQAARLSLRVPDATNTPAASPADGPSPGSDQDDASLVLNDRHNIIALVDEAHRTQQGDLGLAMRAALPNAFLFGLTGTPINRRDRNTFYAFGATEDAHGYLSRYSFETSIRDGATLPLHFEPRRVELHIAKEALDQAFATLTGNLSDLDRHTLGKAASRMAVLVKAPERIAAICADIAKHYRGTVEPNGFKGLVVTFDQVAGPGPRPGCCRERDPARRR